MSSPRSIYDSYRDPVYCLRCNQALYELGQATCTSCGWQYDTERPETYRSEPMFLRWKYWFPAVCLSVASGVISYAMCLTTGELGFALFVAVPISFGSILGYATRAHVWFVVLLALVVVGAVVCALMSMNLAGFFCGLTLAGIFVLPALVGVTLGLILRSLLKSSGWDQRWYLPLLMLAALPYLVQAIELRFPRRHEVATVTTSLTIDTTPEEAWHALTFYEEVEHEPSWLLRLALPRPLRSEGDKTREGSIVRCYYDRGELAKRISRVDPPGLLAFDVVGQELHFERDVRLLDGSFRLTGDALGHTQVELTTRYERQLAPKWLWEPIERMVVGSLHEHVLEGMRRATEAETHHGPPPRDEYPATARPLIAGRPR